MSRHLTALGLLSAGFCLAAGCETDTVAPPLPPDTTVVVLPRSVVIETGDTVRLEAVVATNDGDTLAAAVTWTTRDGAVAAIDPEGLLTAGAPGATWILAQALARIDSVPVTVSAGPVAGPTLQLVTNQVTYPIFLASPPGDGSRLFVVEKGGAIRIVRNGSLLARPFLSVSVSSGSEQGLLSMAFHPAYAQNGLFYVSYTNPAGNTRIQRYQVAATDPDSADPATASLVLGVNQPYSNHNGGLIAFGPDGYLYVGLGDGGDGGDPQNRAQNLDSLLGKMLRLDVDGAPPYAIPGTNPFVGVAGRDEIWALGLRNPWRFSFDRMTGDLYIADVGQGNREEVNFQAAGSAGGANYGWRVMEGTACFLPPNNCSTAGLTLPVTDYGHTGGNCSVTGGYVYRGTALPILAGRYLYADYCTGFVRSFVIAGTTAVDPRDWTMELSPGTLVTSFGEDAAGELYILTAGGSVYRIVPEAPAARR